MFKVSKTILPFSDSLEGFPGPRRAGVLLLTVHYSKSTQIKSTKGNRCIGQSPAETRCELPALSTSALSFPPTCNNVYRVLPAGEGHQGHLQTSEGNKGHGYVSTQVLPYVLLFPLISPKFLVVIHSDKTTFFTSRKRWYLCAPKYRHTLSLYFYYPQATKQMYPFQSNGSGSLLN